MKESRRLELQAQLDQAVSNNDTALANAIRHTIDRETLECTAHTAERLKRVETDVSEIKEMVFEIKDEIREVRSRAKGIKDGATWMYDLLRIAVSVGGGAAVLKILGV